MENNHVWRLKRYGRVVPGSRKRKRQPWKIFEATGKKPEIVLRIVESGYMLILQGEESLDTISLLCASDFLKVNQKSENLMFRLTVKGESRMMRMQFDGSSRAEAIKECSRAVEKLMEYMPVNTQDDAAPSPNQPPAKVSTQVLQVACFTVA
ncbi:Meiotic recombination protein REC114 [Channa argus]|uniref:Meiotic recombination protein REC114 n=1 Tax=Channa argus TaxID=215402 RepID=A0A6G1P9C6_CHAAH|nr:Meiotic recombination protein REC114 [Channa argus]